MTKLSTTNPLVHLFLSQPKNLLNVFFTAGYPKVHCTSSIIERLNEEGVDLIEVGIPFSDPLADGPTIQNSSAVALENGMNLELLFSQLESIDSRAPLILMGYFNSLLNYGIEAFCTACKRSNIAGVIIPDLPLSVYQKKYQPHFEKANLSVIFLVSPTTSEERIRAIDAASTSFIYAVSSSSTTGKKTGISDAIPFLQRLQSMQLKTPFLTGFNIRTSEDVALANTYGSGAIIGSAFINSLTEAEHLHSSISNFIQKIKL